MFLELWNWLRLNQAFQSEAGAEQRFHHSAERPAIVWHSYSDVICRPIELIVYQLDFEVVAGGMMIIEFIEWMMRRKDQMTGRSKQTKEFAEEGVPVSNIVECQRAYNKIKRR